MPIFSLIHQKVQNSHCQNSNSRIDSLPLKKQVIADNLTRIIEQRAEFFRCWYQFWQVDQDLLHVNSFFDFDPLIFVRNLRCCLGAYL